MKMKTLSIITGILTIILGIFALSMPLRIFLGFGWILGILLIANGIEMSVTGFSKKTRNIWQGILGILVAIGGILLIANGISRFFTDLMLAYLIGIVIIISSIGMIANAISTFKESKGRAILLIICGILGIILGVGAVTHPILTMFSAGVIIGMNIIIQGINFIVFGFAAKKVAEKVEEAAAAEEGTN